MAEGQAGVGGTDETAGAAGIGGSVGDAGSGGQPGCLKDSDCSDGVACNGSEKCENGACKPGNAPCSNPDPTHCDAICKELQGAAACSVQGQDKDKDGHLSKACAPQPGDDCNDADNTVHPGATELCDGVDHNCNGKLGVDDGLSAGGTSVQIGPSGAARSAPKIAWAADKSVYGIAYRDTTTSSSADLYFELRDQSGTVKSAASAINGDKSKIGSLAVDPTDAELVDLTWGTDSFGVFWSQEQSPYSNYFEAIGSDGSPGSVVSLPADTTFRNVVMRLAGGSWVVLSADFRTGPSSLDLAVKGYSISAAGVVGPEVDFPTEKQGSGGPYFTAVASGSDFLLVYLHHDSLGSVVSTSGLYTAALASAKSIPVTSSDISGSILDPVVGSGPNGFAIAVWLVSSYQLTTYAASGAAKCGPVNVGDGQNFSPIKMVPTPNGYLLVGYGASGGVSAREVRSDCSVGSVFTVDSAIVNGSIGVAAGATGYGVVWLDNATKAPKRRFFGSRFCN